MRRIWDIHGGIHPEENKQQSNQLSIAAAGIPEELILPLSQHIGAPASPVVAIGDTVLKGQQIAEAKGAVSVPVHASTSGVVVAIEPRLVPHPSGMSARCIVINPDGKDEWIDHQGLENYQQADKATLLQRIREAGIAGMGGAGFPSAVKLATHDDKPINTLIINGTECEPYITADDVLMRERADEIIAGTMILRQLINPTKTLIGIEDNKPEAIAAMQQAAEGSGIEIVSFPTKYPSGGEKQLIQILTGKEVPSGGLPAEVGIVCQNVGTAAAIYRAIGFGEPLISRITTVTGNACNERRNFEVLLGTPIQYLLDRCGFDAAQSSRLIMGGPMMGFALASTDIPVVKTTNCVLAPSQQELPLPAPAQACIRCGMCAEACPASLLPQQLYWFARGKEHEKLEAHHLMDCIECGACSYVCPSNIPLVQYYRASKADIRQQKLDAQKAEQSKARFEARQARIERQEAEKEARRAARKAAAQARATDSADANHTADSNGGESKADAVQAAVERARAKKAALDPAQAAIEKARAKRAGGSSEAPTREVLVQALHNAQGRLASAREKLQLAEQAGSDKVDALRIGIEKTEVKVAEASAALAQFNADHPTPADADAAVPPPKVALSGDAAQDAIAKALAKREAASSMTDEQRLQNAVDSITQRLDKAKAKLSEAEANGDDTKAILNTTVAKLEIKLVDAKQAREDYRLAQGDNHHSSRNPATTD